MTEHKKPTERRNLYCALEDVDFYWDMTKLPDVRFLWLEGYTIEQMSDYFHRPAIEVFLIVLDQLEQGHMGPRTELLFGSPPKSPSKPKYPKHKHEYPAVRCSPTKKQREQDANDQLRQQGQGIRDNGGVRK